ncbi:hypothetical protein IEQ34_007929 [Dendrobium chrysotoxum]|uniref:Uncharacterized protein n=1 Tax=Dendrobium chrysotoxum TaxID=161865 RepID=A0AAV7H368_DENCH|nr:hypothetical protein IEQ34_007929 [Dendrobium chrysotoxum]
MQEAFMRLEQGEKTMMQCKVEYTALANERKILQIFEGAVRLAEISISSIENLGIFKVSGRARLVENDLAISQFKHDMSRKKLGYNMIQGDNSEKWSKFLDSVDREDIGWLVVLYNDTDLDLKESRPAKAIERELLDL